MTEYLPSPAEQLERRIYSVRSELEDLAFMAADKKTAELFGDEILALGECLKWCMRTIQLAQAQNVPQFKEARRA